MRGACLERSALAALVSAGWGPIHSFRLGAFCFLFFVFCLHYTVYNLSVMAKPFLTSFQRKCAPPGSTVIRPLVSNHRHCF